MTLSILGRTGASYLALNLALCLPAPQAAAQPAEGLAPLALWQLAHRFTDTVLLCPERLWPNLEWRELRVVFILRGNAAAVSLERAADQTWSASAVSAERAEFRAVDAPREYAILRAGNLRTVVVFLPDLRERSIHRSVEVAAHEAFHAVGQQRFARAARMERGREIPSDWAHRYARRMMIERLFEAHQQEVFLAKAAFWYRQTIDQTAPKLIAMRTLDRLEGSAEYAGALGAALYKEGCFASDPALRAGARLRYLERWGSARTRDQLHAFPDGESYVLGLLAGLLLDEAGDSTWKWQVENGRAPADILLAGREPQRDDGYPQLRQSIQEALAQQDGRYLPRLKEMIARVDAGEDYVVAIPARSRIGTFTPSWGFFLFNDGNRPRHFILGVHGRFALVELRGQDVFEESATPCGRGMHWVFPVPRAAVLEDDERASVKSEAVIIPKVRRIQSRWLCVD